MKLMFLACFFIICGHAISNMAFQGNPTSKDEDFTHSDTVKHGKVNGLNGYGKDKCKGDRFRSIKAQRGAHGSSNIVHRPGPKAERSAASLTVKKPAFSPLFLSATMGYVSLALCLIFSL